MDAHHDPRPHVKAGRIIASLKVATSLIDVSDGVAADLGHICAQSNVGAIIEEEKIPTTEGFQSYCRQFTQDARHLSLHVGEDYVLLGTVPEEVAGDLEGALQSNECEFYPIGKTVVEPGLKVIDRDGSIPYGFHARDGRNIPASFPRPRKKEPAMSGKHRRSWHKRR